MRRRTPGWNTTRRWRPRRLFPSCNSWYVGANVPGKPRTVTPYTGGFATYIEKCDAVVANGYEGILSNRCVSRPRPKGRGRKRKSGGGLVR